MSDVRVEKLVEQYRKMLRPGREPMVPLEATAMESLKTYEAAGLAVRVKDDNGKLADQVKDLIFERTQLVDGDAYDLAWDVLNLLQGESNA